MKHGQVQRCLLRLLDGELTPAQAAEVRQHLDECPACAGKLVQLEQIWTSARQTGREEPPPFLATRVAVRIRESERDRHGLIGLSAICRQLVHRAVLLALGIGAIALCVFLGGTPQNLSATPAKGGPSYLDSFDDLPARSVGGVHAALAGASE